MEGEIYDGIPIERLPLEEVFDPRRLIGRDPSSRTGEAVRVVGYSTGMGRLLVVVLVPDRHPPDGIWHVATAWPADKRVRQAYRGLREV
ncbi:hypothetical protein [Amycolatopsis eburnea]|uniref:BrnT family toxin n=1 Tax=Amycolatopsis eburnea TaxID=2267691 RepID=A0A3R9ETI9_9PSEU|nr:hypothetical protein [Amycolatopsis eburnea]RSD19955.1 hypothetical protein EIY87_17155 [Amycolatopsis eburnea]